MTNLQEAGNLSKKFMRQNFDSVVNLFFENIKSYLEDTVNQYQHLGETDRYKITSTITSYWEKTDYGYMFTSNVTSKCFSSHIRTYTLISWSIQRHEFTIGWLSKALVKIINEYDGKLRLIIAGQYSDRDELSLVEEVTFIKLSI
jgi:hypothetical protein